MNRSLGTLNLGAGAVPGTTSSYTSSTPGVCTVSASGVVSLVGAGTCTVLATPSGAGSAGSASTSMSLQVAPARDVTASLPPGTTSAPVPRLSGTDRVATAVDTAARLYPAASAPAVVVAPSTTFADSLAGSRLAAMGGGGRCC